MSKVATRRVRNRAGGESGYTITNEPLAPFFFAVCDTRRGRQWTVDGRGEVTRGKDTPPSYVLAAVEREWARYRLRDMLRPGEVVYTVLHNVSRSGMSRRIGVRAIVKNAPYYLDGLVHAAAPDYFPLPEHGDGIRMGGCGMDMGFHLVYTLSRILYPDGFRCTGDDDCPSNDHANDHYREPYPSKSERYSRRRLHTDGGYALRQRWL